MWRPAAPAWPGPQEAGGSDRGLKVVLGLRRRCLGDVAGYVGALTVAEAVGGEEFEAAKTTSYPEINGGPSPHAAAATHNRCNADRALIRLKPIGALAPPKCPR